LLHPNVTSRVGVEENSYKKAAILRDVAARRVKWSPLTPSVNEIQTVGEKVRRERRWTSAGAIPARELVRSTR
jgi:hypothetical protein